MGTIVVRQVCGTFPSISPLCSENPPHALLLVACHRSTKLGRLVLNSYGEGQSHGTLERISYAEYVIMRPHGDSLGFRGLFPLHIVDHGRVGCLNQCAEV
jgi:hypothetical protein